MSSAKSKATVGSSLDDFLEEQGLYEDANDEAIKHVLSYQIEQHKEKLELSKSDKSSFMDTTFTKAQQTTIDKLSPSDLGTIDTELISICTDQWQKVAKIVGMFMLQNKERYTGIPDAFFASRLYKHVDDGRLESQGSLGCMSQCEVRIISTKT